MKWSDITREEFDALDIHHILVASVGGTDDVYTSTLGEIRALYHETREEHQGPESPTNAQVLAWNHGDGREHNGNNTDVIVWWNGAFERLPAIVFEG